MNLFSTRSSLATLLFFSLAISSHTVHAQTAHDDHHEHGKAKISLNHGKKWSSDAALRQHMEKLNKVFTENTKAIHAKILPNDAYQQLAAQTKKSVNEIIAQCKLEPKADAMLHMIIADMLTGADMMSAKEKAKQGQGAHKVVVALNNYGRYFDHPHWVTVK